VEVHGKDLVQEKIGEIEFHMMSNENSIEKSLY